MPGSDCPGSAGTIQRELETPEGFPYPAKAGVLLAYSISSTRSLLLPPSVDDSHALLYNSLWINVTLAAARDVPSIVIPLDILMPGVTSTDAR